jgi:TRAP-type C4-dicarboxylate transport system substrate-binding protein
MSPWVPRVYRLRMWAVRAVAVVAALLALPMLTTTGCAQQVMGPTLVLRLASPDKATDDTAAPIKHFAAEVDRRSGGAMRIEPVWDVATGRDWDRVTARSVLDGTNDLGFIPSRVFDQLGVDSLRALNTPFLVTSLAAERAVLESDLRGDLLAGLPDGGMVGLDLFPDGLRHPFGYDRPLLGAADYDGGVIRAARSDTVDRLFAALGASTTDDDESTHLDGAEQQFSLAPAGAAVATGNVTFFVKMNVLMASRSVAERLRPDQWAVLADAADASRRWQMAHLPSDREAAAAYCRSKGSVVSASDEQVAELRDLAGRVTDWLNGDAATRRMIDRIGKVVADVAPEDPVTSCPSRSGGASTVSDVLDGRYFAHIRRRDLVRAGVTNENQILENTGRLTFTADSGRWTYRTRANHFVSNPVDEGRYEVDGSTFTFFWDEGDGDWTRMTFRKGPDGTLYFSDIVDGHPEDQLLSEGWFGVPWTRLGDLPD